MIEGILHDRPRRRPEVGHAGAEVEQVIRRVPRDQRSVGERAGSRRDERVEVRRRRRAKVPVDLVVDGAGERGEQPLLRVAAQRIKPFARALRPLRRPPGDEQLAQQQVRDRLPIGRRIGRSIADRIERIDRRRRRPRAGAEGDGDRPEGEQASGGAKKARTHRRAL